MVLLAMLFACSSGPADAVEAISAKEVPGLLTSASTDVHVVSLWAMWCGPCLDEVEELRTLKDSDAHVSLVNIDSPALYERKAAPWLIGRDWSGVQMYRMDSRDPVAELSRALPSWGGGLPYTLVMRPGGVVCETHKRALVRADVEEAIERCRQ